MKTLEDNFLCFNCFMRHKPKFKREINRETPGMAHTSRKRNILVEQLAWQTLEGNFIINICEYHQFSLHSLMYFFTCNNLVLDLGFN